MGLGEDKIPVKTLCEAGPWDWQTVDEWSDG